MCGIVSYWSKESVLSRKDYDILFTGAEQRGQDGIGICIVDLKTTKHVSYKMTKTYSECKENVLDFIVMNMKVNNLLLGICRATPETEPITSIEQLQPIIKDGLYLIHNGGVTESVVKDWDCKLTTSIDSEYIIEAYKKYGNNMKNAMENISGSFAFVLYDSKKDKLFSVTSFNPLAHMYSRGYGYFLSSDNNTLENVLQNMTNQSSDGVNVWESWYHHYLQGYSIIETDIQSGFQSNYSYEPMFLYPNEIKEKPKNKNKVIVCCSGGIDSGLSALVLKNAGYDVTMYHFKYGQKAQDAEEWAVKKLAKKMDMDLIIKDVRNLFDFKQSMLLDDNIEIDTGTDKIKSTIAWVPGRNAIFTTILLAEAENMILTEGYEKVYISAGWAQLSEETGGYPDNSFKFSDSINEFKNYGYITGTKIDFLPVMQKITKTEEWILGDYLDFPFEYTVSCDNPKMDNDGTPILCKQCGSTKLSIIASRRAGIADNRRFNSFISPADNITKINGFDIVDIIDRLVLTKKEKDSIKR